MIVHKWWIFHFSINLLEDSLNSLPSASFAVDVIPGLLGWRPPKVSLCWDGSCQGINGWASRPVLLVSLGGPGDLAPLSGAAMNHIES